MCQGRPLSAKGKAVAVSSGSRRGDPVVLTFPGDASRQLKELDIRRGRAVTTRGWGWGPEVREAHGKRGFQGWARAELYAGHGVPMAGQRERGRGLPGRGAGPGSALLRFGGGFASPSLMVPALGMAPWRFLPQCLV